MNHKELVDIALKWVLKKTTCGVAFKELNTHASNGEYPDVIGFGAWGHSVLIECKASRSDFLSDKKKSFRKNPELGMGSQRFYCCPTGLIKPEELPQGWGLVYVNEKHKAICVQKAYRGNVDERDGMAKNMLAEHGLMYSVLRRLHLRGLIDTIYSPPETKYIVLRQDEPESNENTSKTRQSMTV